MAEPAKGALALEPGTHHTGAALAPAPPVGALAAPHSVTKHYRPEPQGTGTCRFLQELPVWPGRPATGTSTE